MAKGLKAEMSSANGFSQMERLCKQEVFATHGPTKLCNSADAALGEAAPEMQDSGMACVSVHLESGKRRRS